MGKRLGQHFLKDRRYLRRIAGALAVQPGEVVVEIGPGHGELTRELLKTPVARLIVIEKDRELVATLKKNFQIPNVKCQTSSIPAGYLPKGDKSQIPNIEVVEGDALEILPKLIRNLKLSRCARSRVAGEIRNSGYKIAGNIPFYLTGRLLRIIGELTHKPARAVLTVQKEVAERICAHPRGMNPVRGRPAEEHACLPAGRATAALGRPASNGMNLLAASVQIWADPEIVGYIPRESFHPRPKVDSAIITLTPTSNYLITQLPNYYRFLKILFKQPRKTILNNLAHTAAERHAVTRALRAAGINANDRPQNLSVKDILALSQVRYTEKR